MHWSDTLQARLACRQGSPGVRCSAQLRSHCDGPIVFLHKHKHNGKDKLMQADYIWGKKTNKINVTQGLALANAAEAAAQTLS